MAVLSSVSILRIHKSKLNVGAETTYTREMTQRPRKMETLLRKSSYLLLHLVHEIVSLQPVGLFEHL
jgi:hypothetical protein